MKGAICAKKSDVLLFNSSEEGIEVVLFYPKLEVEEVFILKLK